MVTLEAMLPHVCRNKGELTSEEIQDAKACIIKSTQQKTFRGEYRALKSKKAFLT